MISVQILRLHRSVAIRHLRFLFDIPLNDRSKCRRCYNYLASQPMPAIKRVRPHSEITPLRGIKSPARTPPLEPSTKVRLVPSSSTTSRLKRRKTETTALAGQIMPDADVVFELSPVESTLRQLLIDVAQFIDSSTQIVDSGTQLPNGLADAKLELRFTGGWVRDKLLNIPSMDIDVAINKMTGYQFGLKLKEYLDIPGNSQRYSFKDVDQVQLAVPGSESKSAAVASGFESHKHKGLGGLHKIEANPEKSKHLETVTTKLLGLDIDLVNLRKETYSEDSRNPQMEFGTPEEDALRRDATVNALFYNIHTTMVEDFTGRGFDDLKLGVIRTPLEPHQTFKDDPLRVLRLIRFASRLNFEIDGETQISMADDTIKSALRVKISRERVGVEVEKMLKGKNPFRALELIDHLGLYSTIFTDPGSTETPSPDLTNWWMRNLFVHGLLLPESLSDADLRTRIQNLLIRDANDRYLAWTLAALAPCANLADAPALKPGKRDTPMAAILAREGLRINNKVFDVIVGAWRHLEEVRGMVAALNDTSNSTVSDSNKDGLIQRGSYGMAIRRWGKNWRSFVLLSLILDVKPAEHISGPEDTIKQRRPLDDIAKRFFSSDHLTGTLESYARFLERLRGFDILEAYSMKPLVDGKQLASLLKSKPGPWMKPALDVVMEWQLRHPGETDPSGAVLELEQRREELEIT